MTAPVTDNTFETARIGDRAAITLLLSRAQPNIRRYAQATCRTASDAEDATQEALWLLTRHIGAINALATLSGWLFSVVRRECLRLARKAGLTTPVDPDSPEAGLAERTDHELRMDIASAFEALPPHYREIALMRDVQEMTITEIATSLGLSRQATKARLHRARLLLREYLEK